MTNGYIVLTKGEPNLYKHALEAISLGKPIYYADGNKVAFVNSIELVSTDVVIKTSDTQITVESDGDTTEDELIKTYNIIIVGEYSDNKRYSLTFKKEASSMNTSASGDELIAILQSLYYDMTIDNNGNGIVQLIEAKFVGDDLEVTIMLTDSGEESATNPTITIREL